VDAGDSGLGAHGVGGRGVVAGEHGDCVALAVQLGDDCGCFGSQLVADRDRADDLPVVLDQDSGGTGFLHLLHVASQVPGGDPAGPSQPHRPTLDHTGQAGAGERLDVGGVRHGVDRGEDRPG